MCQIYYTTGYFHKQFVSLDLDLPSDKKIPLVLQVQGTFGSQCHPHKVDQINCCLLLVPTFCLASVFLRFHPAALPGVSTVTEAIAFSR